MKRIAFLISTVLFFGCGEDLKTPVPNANGESTINVIHDRINGESVVLYANNNKGIFKAFKAMNANGDEVVLSVSNAGLPLILEDDQGNTYDFSGKITSGAEGKNLLPIEQVVGYWFFFPAFYSEIEFFSGESILNSSYPHAEPNKIDEQFVFSGSFPDGIPSIDNAEFLLLEGKELIENSFYNELDNSELAVVFLLNDKKYILPHRILEYHEVTNLSISGESIVLSYCPLTGTSKAWSRVIKNKTVEFGVSGLLYNNNLILYDRESDTDWSQILGLAINGEYSLEEVDEIEIVEMTIQSAKALGSNSFFLSTNTGFNFDYSSSLYNRYKSDDRISFPLTNRDDRLHPKERVIGIPDGDNVRVYRFDDFKNQN